ncbi:MAG: hypothetical protein PUF75_06245 [Coprococcus sp.]|nr:hypothetical protein [Coprococcus sp.]
MAGNFFQNAFEKTKSLANQAVDSTKCAAQKTKIKGKISSENSNLDRIYTEIGRYYYNLNKEEAPEEIKHLFDSAAKGLENIAALDKEYREVEEQEHRIMNSGNQYQQTPPQGMYNPQMNGMPPQGMYNPQMNGMPPQGMAPQMNGMPQQGMYNPQMNGMPPQGMAPQMNGMPPQGMAPQMNEMPPQQNPAPAPQAGPVQESVPAVAPTSQPEAVPQNEEVSQ